MTEPFELPVLYKGSEIAFPAQLLVKGYIHQFEVLIDGLPVYFEQDDHGEYRALLDGNHLNIGKPPDYGLLEAITVAIKSVLQ